MNLIAKYTKKPVTIEAIQFAGDEDTLSNVHGFAGDAILPNVGIDDSDKYYVVVQTLEGEMRATEGDWIIKGVKGEFYPCKPDIFEATYVKADSDFADRLLTETREVATRLNKLNTFMASDAFPKLPREDKDLLYSQQRVMSEYVQILGKRLERAGRQFEHSK